MKKVEIIHKEKKEECFEILKRTIVEDKELKKYRIDYDTLISELPESIVNEFLDFLGSDEQHRDLMLHMIKTGSLIIHCWEDDEGNNEKTRIISSNNKKSKVSGIKQPPFNSDEGTIDAELPF
ncbi:MAG: hypothetical protein Q8R96_15180 [Bacteroidota bacterium]|nr:hypothetical protein [Bacteroidota bacterium]